MEHPSVVLGRGTVRGLWNPWSPYERAFSERFAAEAKRRGLGGIRLRLLATRPRIDLDVRRPLEGLRDGTRAVRELKVDVKAQIEMEPSPANRVSLDESRRDAFGNPGAGLFLRFSDNDRRTIQYCEEIVRRLLAELGAENVEVETGAVLWDHHHMGTCRMGDDPSGSVVDRDLRVHGSDNLYVAGSAPFVTGGVSNPTLTIVALSLRLADHLTARLRG
jgi:choline dehydrogenase-like flavoprotein